MSTRGERTADKSLNEKHSKILKELMQRPDNRKCADCRKRDPRWASWNLGIFVCIRCSGIHRSLGVHISKVKSADLDTWTPEQVQNMLKWGNGKANQYWEYDLPSNIEPPEGSIEQWIRAKYERKQFAAKGPIPDPDTLSLRDSTGLDSNAPQAQQEVLSKPPLPARNSSPALVKTTRPPPPPPSSSSFMEAKKVQPVQDLLGVFEPTSSFSSTTPSKSTSPSNAVSPSVTKIDLKANIMSLYSSASSAPAAPLLQNSTRTSNPSLASFHGSGHNLISTSSIGSSSPPVAMSDFADFSSFSPQLPAVATPTSSLSQGTPKTAPPDQQSVTSMVGASNAISTSTSSSATAFPKTISTNPLEINFASFTLQDSSTKNTASSSYSMPSSYQAPPPVSSSASSGFKGFGDFGSSSHWAAPVTPAPPKTPTVSKTPSKSNELTSSHLYNAWDTPSSPTSGPTVDNIIGLDTVPETKNTEASLLDSGWAPSFGDTSKGTTQSITKAQSSLVDSWDMPQTSIPSTTRESTGWGHDLALPSTSSNTSAQASDPITTPPLLSSGLSSGWGGDLPLPTAPSTLPSKTPEPISDFLETKPVAATIGLTPLADMNPWSDFQ